MGIKPGDTHHGHKAAALRALQHYCPRYFRVLFVFSVKVCIVVHCLGQCLISEVIEPQLLQPSNPHPLTIVALYLDFVFNNHLQRTSAVVAKYEDKTRVLHTGLDIRFAPTCPNRPMRVFLVFPPTQT